jgi:hypothetical protein
MAELPSPVISIIVTSRNDDHGGGMLLRMQTFVNCLLDQCNRHQLNAELILVEWNPPDNRPPIAEALQWPSESTAVVRILEVPNSIHRRFQHSDSLSLFQMIAKNAGIRRSRADHVLTTNVDILFSEELIRFLKFGEIQNHFLYRVNRYDVPADIPRDLTVPQKLEYCRNHLLRIHSKNGSLNVSNGQFTPMYSPFHSMPYALVNAMERYFPARIKNQIWYREHRRLYTTRRKLHTNGSGDFMLMARKHWFDLRGYSEFQGYSFHLDSVLCYAVASAGIQEKILKDPMRIYHMEHGGGWTPEIQKAGTFDRRLEQAGISKISDAQLNAWALQMQVERKPLMFNADDWGLANEDLHETVVSAERV